MAEVGRGRERKPHWRELPPDLRRDVEALLGAPVRRSQRAYGGYGPSVTLHLALADGRSVFVKGAGPTSNEVNWATLDREERLYQTPGPWLDLSPRYFGSLKRPGWHLLFLEDLGHRGRVPPWTGARAERVLDAVARLHAHATPPDWLQDAAARFGGNWVRLRDDADARATFLRLFGEPGSARQWLAESLPTLLAAEADAFSLNQPWGLVHTDIRSDNLRVVGPTVRLFDWANVARGPLILDPVAFLPSLAAESGIAPDGVLRGYLGTARALGLDIDPARANPPASLIAGYFAARAGLPVPEELPRLRRVQRAQLEPALSFAARLLDLPEPPALHAPT